MTYMMCHQNVDEREDVWHIDASGGLATAKVWPTRAIALEWQDGTRERLLARFNCYGLPSGATTVDLTLQDYYVVVGKGQSVPWLVLVSDIGTLDGIMPRQPWSILRVLGKWGSAPYWPGGSTALPAGVQGAILRFENGAWQTLPIGNLDDSLHVATGPYGLRPVWGGASTTVNVISDTTAHDASNRVLALWNGTGNNAEPSNWKLSTFDDSGWAPIVEAPLDAASHPTPVGAVWVTYDPGTVPQDAAWLLRKTFALFRPVTACTLTYNCDDWIEGIWINGTQVAAPDHSASFAIVTITVPPSLFVATGTNVLAAMVRNHGEVLSGGQTGFAGLLAITT